MKYLQEELKKLTEIRQMILKNETIICPNFYALIVGKYKAMINYILEFVEKNM